MENNKLKIFATLEENGFKKTKRAFFMFLLENWIVDFWNDSEKETKEIFTKRTREKIISIYRNSAKTKQLIDLI
jgi:hypothetical protein